MAGLNAQAYLNSLMNSLNRHGLTNNIMFLSTDGAKVVSSDQNGLVGLLRKNHIPHLIAVQCIAHKTCLGVKDIAKQYDSINKLNNRIYKLCSFFHTKKKLDIL